MRERFHIGILVSGKELLTLRGHSDAVSGVAFSPDGKRLATGSADQTAKVWDAESGKELLTLRGHSNAFVGVAFSPVATASSEKNFPHRKSCRGLH